MPDVKVGDRVTVVFTFEVDGIRKNMHKDGILTLTGWITDEQGKCIELVSIPNCCLVNQ